MIRKLYDKVKEERKVRKTLITRDDEEGEEEEKQKVAGLEERQEENGTEGDNENESEEDDEVEDKEAAAEKEILGRAIFFKVSKFSHGNLLPEPNNALPKITLKMNQEEIDPALLSDDWDENLTEMEFFDSGIINTLFLFDKRFYFFRTRRHNSRRGRRLRLRRRICNKTNSKKKECFFYRRSKFHS